MSEPNHGLVANLGGKLISVLPPAFLLLVILNVGFIAMATWIYDHNSEARAVLLTKIVDACLLDRKSAPP